MGVPRLFINLQDDFVKRCQCESGRGAPGKQRDVGRDVAPMRRSNSMDHSLFNNERLPALYGDTLAVLTRRQRTGTAEFDRVFRADTTRRLPAMISIFLFLYP